jgi:D-alanine-D-alanine ligase
MSTPVAVLFGGPSPEHDISILTGLQAERLLAQGGREVAPVYWDRAGRWHLVPSGSEARDFLDGAPAKSRPLELRVSGDQESGFYLTSGLRAKRLPVEAVLNCLHGGDGENGGVQGLLKIAGVPSTGSSVASAALGMDKLAFGCVMAASGVPSLERTLLSAENPPSNPGPYIVKPRYGGSSIGIEVVDDHATALALLNSSVHLRRGAVLEPYRPDLFDLNVSVRTWPRVECSQIERPFRPEDGSIYSYSAKYLHAEGLANAPREMPAKISAELAEQITTLARRVVELTGLTGIIRIDFLSDGTELFVNEVNSIPGAMALYLWPDEDPVSLLTSAVDESLQSVDDAVPSYEEGVALRAAGGIAGKLAALPQTRA